MSAPVNNFNASNVKVTVFDTDGVEIKTTRPNARELVAMGTHFWKKTDIGAQRVESDGPEDPKAKMVIIFNKETGEPVEVSRANARDMVGTGQYTWVKAHAETSEEPQEPAAEDTTDVVDEGDTDAPSEDQEPSKEDAPSDEPLDPETAPLAALSQRAIGSPDVEKYLEGFSEDTLKQMADQRYGQSFHHRAQKPSMITKMVEFEAEKLNKEDEDQADA